MQEYRKFICEDCEAIIYLKSIACLKALQLVRESGERETGGILIGRYSSCLRKVYINEFGDAPKDSKSGFSWFVRGVKGLGEYLKKKWQQNEEYYLGEWHYHPANVPEPSLQDRTQLRKISVDGRFNCKEPVLIVVSKGANEYILCVSLLIGSRIYKYQELGE